MVLIHGGVRNKGSKYNHSMRISIAASTLALSNLAPEEKFYPLVTFWGKKTVKRIKPS
jgi:hypothetical protein